MQIPLANIQWRFLLVRDDWGFQVNPLCRHDITRSDRQIGNRPQLVTSNYLQQGGPCISQLGLQWRPTPT